MYSLMRVEKRNGKVCLRCILHKNSEKNTIIMYWRRV